MIGTHQNPVQRQHSKPISVVDLAFVAFVLWFASYAYLFVFSLGGPKPLYSYVILVVVACLVLTLLILKNGRSSAIPYPTVAFVAAMVGYLSYGHLSFIHSSQSAASVQGYVTLVESVLIALSMLVILWDARRIQFASTIFAVLAIFAICLNLWDFIFPAFSDVRGRAAGLYENPNMSGTFIVLAMVAGIGAVPSRFRSAFVFVCGIGVLITFSRGAWAAWFIGVGGLYLTRIIEIPSLKGIVIASALLVTIGILIGGIVTSIASVIDQLMASGLLTSNTAARLGIGGDVFSGFAAYDRLTVAGIAFEEFQEAPIFGHGLSYTAEWSYAARPHNMFLLMAVEGGLLGLCTYLGLLIVLWVGSSGIGRILVLLLVFSGLFSHNHLEQPTILLIMAFISVHGVFARRNGSVVRPALNSAGR